MTVIISDAFAPRRPALQVVSAEEAGIETEAETPRIHPWCFRPTLRFDYETAERLLMTGNCLQPWFKDGDVAWFQRELEPRDGDLTACTLLYKCRIGAAIGKTIWLTAIKQYRVIDGRTWLVAADGCLDASAEKIIGVVTAWHRRGWWKRPSVRTMKFEP